MNFECQFKLTVGLEHPNSYFLGTISIKTLTWYKRIHVSGTFLLFLNSIWGPIIQCLSDIMTFTLWQNRPKSGTVTVFQMSQIPFQYSTGRMGWIAHRKWKEIKQQPGTARPGNLLGCCLLSFHFLWSIHPIHPVELSPCDNYRPVTIFWPCPEVVTICISDNYCSWKKQEKWIF